MKRSGFFFALFLLSFSFSHALDGTIELQPKNPQPYSSVTLTLSSYSFNVSTANIVWSSGKKELLSGFGARRLLIRTGGVGTKIPITVTATTADGSSFESTIEISPQSVTLLYETPESYVPPFYEGRSLPGEGATVRVTALPAMSENGAKLSPKSLSYTWYLNDELLDDLSGAGRQVLTVPLDYIRQSTDVRVLVTSPLGEVAENVINIYPHPVLPMLYTYDDVLGTNVANRIVQRFETTKDFTLSFVPYFLSANGPLEQTAVYTWLLDGLPITPIGGRLLSLTPKKDSFGARPLSITTENSVRRMQTAQLDLDLVFDTRK